MGPGNKCQDDSVGCGRFSFARQPTGNDDDGGTRKEGAGLQAADRWRQQRRAEGPARPQGGGLLLPEGRHPRLHDGGLRLDRKSVGLGKSVSVRVDPGGRRSLKKKKAHGRVESVSPEYYKKEKNK